MTDGAIRAAVEKEAGEAKHVVVVDLLLRNAEVVRHCGRACGRRSGAGYMRARW